VKALGEGLHRRLQLVHFGEDEHARVRLHYDRCPGGSAGRWQFDDIAVDDRHVACLVRCVQDNSAPHGEPARP
jgi:4'-phosphopantetheinyl transferase